jgi:hypothetical protein
VVAEYDGFLDLTPTQMEELRVSNYRTYHILNEIVDQWVVWSLKGGVAVPPPIQSRTYQIISEAQLAFNAAQKIQSTPFPYPLMQVRYRAPSVDPCQTRMHECHRPRKGRDEMEIRGRLESSCSPKPRNRTGNAAVSARAIIGRGGLRADTSRELPRRSLAFWLPTRVYFIACPGTCRFAPLIAPSSALLRIPPSAS